MTTPLYQIVDWDERYENNRSRMYPRSTYVLAPNDMGPEQFAILSSYNGGAVMGFWHLLLMMCSRHRRPREGWLTADGRRDGWRITVEEFAHMWKYPAPTVRHCLAVLRSPQVGLIKLVEGTAEKPVSATDNVAGSATDNVAGSATDNVAGSATDKLPAAQPAESVSNKVTNSTPCSPPQPQEMNGAEADDTQKSISFEQARDWINTLFRGRQMPWSSEEKYLLKKLLPIPPEVRAMLSWAYTLPRDNAGWALVDGDQLDKPKTNCLRFLREFPSEVEKWRLARATLNGDFEEELESDDGWTEERLAIRDELFPDYEWPEEFRQLSVHMQRRFNQVVIERRAIA